MARLLHYGSSNGKLRQLNFANTFFSILGSSALDQHVKSIQNVEPTYLLVKHTSYVNINNDGKEIPGNINLFFAMIASLKSLRDYFNPAHNCAHKLSYVIIEFFTGSNFLFGKTHKTKEK